MRLLLNNSPVDTAQETLSRLLAENYDTLSGMAVAVNNKIVSRDKWDTTYLSENDDIVVIVAAFGG